MKKINLFEPTSFISKEQGYYALRPLLVLGFLLFLLVPNSQAQFYEWALGITGPSPNVGQRVEINDQGQVFAAGEFRDSADFDPGSGQVWLSGSPGAERSYLASYNSDGTYRWAFRVADRTPYSTAQTLFQDDNGSVWVGGSFFGVADFDPGPDSNLVGTPLLPSTYVAKYSDAGSLDWVQVFPTTFILVNGAANPSGEFVLLGYFSGTIDIDPGAGYYPLVSNGSNDIALAAFNSNGVLQWAQNYGGPGNDLGNDIVLTSTGEIVMTGSFSDVANFDPNGNSPSLISNGGWDIFMASYESDGDYLWAKGIGGPLQENDGRLALNDEGEITLAGYFRGTVDFDPGAGQALLTSDGNGDGFLGHYTSQGEYKWVQKIAADQSLNLSRVKVDANKKASVAGFFSGNIHLDPDSGATAISSNGGIDAFIGTYDSTGSFIRGSNFGNTGVDVFSDLAICAENMIHVTGFFTGSVDFDPGPGQGILTSMGGFDIVVAKYAPCRTEMVSTTADSGPGSLREVIANACEGALIAFSPALLGDTLEVSSGGILMDKSLMIQGLGTTEMVISGGNASRIFDIKPGVKVHISDLTLANGMARLQGGAIYNEADVDLLRVNLIGNTATRLPTEPATVPSYAQGGAIYNALGASLNMEACILEQNIAGAVATNAFVQVYGGAVYNEGIASLTACVLINNRASAGTIGGLPIAYGGALYSTGVLSLLDCELEANIAFAQNSSAFSSSLGGAVYNTGMLEASRTSLIGNRCANNGMTGTTGFGGGLYNDGPADFENCTFSGNRAEGMGVSGNSAGGAIYNTFNGIVSLRYCTLTLNVAEGTPSSSAGGNFNFGEMEMTGTILAANLAQGTGNDGANTGNLVSGGYNLFGDSTSLALNADPSDLLGNSLSPLDPMLDTLGTYGGITSCHGLLVASPAIDAGAEIGTLLTDQRNYFRAAGARLDIGSFEAGADLLVKIVEPLEGDSFQYFSEILVKAQLPSQTQTYLEISCPDNGWRKLQIGNNPQSKWGPRVDVVAGGNDSIVFILRDPNEDIDWSRIRVHPDGNTAMAVSLGNYLPAGGVTANWTRVSIPLADFNSGINFSSLAFLEFPYSDQAGAFDMHVQEISFVGGPNPYLWFGEGKTDNNQNGTGGPYLLSAQVVDQDIPLVEAEYVSFYANGQFFGQDSVAPYEVPFMASIVGNQQLIAQATLSDGSVFSSLPVNIHISSPEVVITSPEDSAIYLAPAFIPLEASVFGVAGDAEFLQVISPDGNWRKLKLGYNANSLWGPKVDVTTGGNDQLEITLRDPNGDVDWSKIRIHPDGNLNNPIVLGDYLPSGSIVDQWTTLTIPLSDFDPGINFSNISFMEVPYSNAAGAFEIHIQDIRFTGGTSPFYWFGNGHTNNANDGIGGTGQLTANLVSSNLQVVKVEFYEGNSTLIGTDSLPPYNFLWEFVPIGIYQVTAVATFTDGMQITSSPVNIEVQNNTRQAAETPGMMSVSAYPNPASQRVWVNAETSEAGMAELNLSDATGRSLYQHAFEMLEGINTREVDLQGLPAGIYLLTISRTDLEWKHSMKIIKQ